MIEIGKHITLTILRETDPGLYLGKDEESEDVVLLPHKYKPETFEEEGFSFDDENELDFEKLTFEGEDEDVPKKANLKNLFKIARKFNKELKMK